MAVKNVFQHQTVTRSAFYNWQAHHNNSTPDFIERITDEGYARSGGAENLNAGFPTALASYLSWWNSADHRTNMYDVGNDTSDKIRREIGYGYFFSAPATYDHYDTMVISRRTAFPGFFTDTIFRDSNSNSVYNEGEGVARIRIDLKNNGFAHGSYDVSTAAGNFAIPLTGITAGNTVQVHLTNTTNSILVLSIPTNFQNLNTLQLNPGQKWLWGSFSRSTEANAGFRNLTLSVTQPLAIPKVMISTASGRAVLNWQSQPGFTYQAQWSVNLQPPWNNLNAAQSGTGGMLSTTDPANVTTTKSRFYRLLITGP